MKIKNKEVVINKDEKAIDWVGTFAKIITENDVQRWLSDKELYINKKDCSNPPVRAMQ